MSTAASLVLAVLLAMLSGVASAHKSSDAYLQFVASPGSLKLRWDIALRDLDVELDLDANADGALSWREVRDGLPRIEAYAVSHVAIAGCDLRLTGSALEHRSDGAYVALFLESGCDLKSLSGLQYSLFVDVDPTHRGIAKLLRAGQDPEVLLLDPTQSRLHPTGRGVDDEPHVAPSSGGVASGQFLMEGVRHILSGYDHLLFLFCLLLTSVIHRTRQGWRAVDDKREVILSTIGTLTAFTVAHSITLALSATKTVSLPPAFVEPAIAATIALTAVDNLVPIFPSRRASVAFCFGLVHGCGFASALSELDLGATQFALALLEFNVGLEVGQLAVMAVAVFVLYGLRRWRHYEVVVIGGGSTVAIAIAALWFVERL